MTPTVASIHRYPVKSMHGESLTAIEVATDAHLPLDRRFALALGKAGIDPAAPVWKDKVNFVVLMKHERMAEFAAAFDELTGRLTITRKGALVAETRVDSPASVADLNRYFTDAFADIPTVGQVSFIDYRDGNAADSLSDQVSVINLASVRDLASRTGKVIDPRRFRGNLLLDGLRPWEELGWVGKDIDLGGGNVVLHAYKPTTRCAATTVNPDTGLRDIPEMLRLLVTTCGNPYMGLNTRVTKGGLLRVGQPAIVQIR